jgi:hypothetical protein
VEASSTPTIRRLTPSCRHQLPALARSAVRIRSGAPLSSMFRASRTGTARGHRGGTARLWLLKTPKGRESWRFSRDRHTVLGMITIFCAFVLLLSFRLHSRAGLELELVVWRNFCLATGVPSASAPSTRNICLARSNPMVVICFTKRFLHVVLQATITLWHTDAAIAGPFHTIKKARSGYMPIQPICIRVSEIEELIRFQSCEHARSRQ